MQVCAQEQPGTHGALLSFVPTAFLFNKLVPKATKHWGMCDEFLAQKTGFASRAALSGRRVSGTGSVNALDEASHPWLVIMGYPGFLPKPISFP